jgi:hypothetical protein
MRLRSRQLFRRACLNGNRESEQSSATERKNSHKSLSFYSDPTVNSQYISLSCCTRWSWLGRLAILIKRIKKIANGFQVLIGILLKQS